MHSWLFTVPLQVHPTHLLHLMLLGVQSNTAFGFCMAVCISSLCCKCRPREKINRPILRNRRRGNDIDSLQKLQTIRQNQMDAIKVVQFLIKRERKKRDITVCSADSLVNGLMLSLLVWADFFELSSSRHAQTVSALAFGVAVVSNGMHHDAVNYRCYHTACL